MLTVPEPTAGTGVLTDAQFHRLRDFLYQYAGLHFADAKRFLLECRLQKRLRDLSVEDVDAYLDQVTAPGRGAAELRHLLDVVTTHETSFFRTRPQLEAFQRHVLRKLVEQRQEHGQRRLRFWSAACSTGEEPYTLAMLALETLGAELARWEVRVLGTDISTGALEQAVRGEYGHHSFRTTPAYYIGKYFEAQGRDLYRLREAPRRLVEFKALNFADTARMRLMRDFDVIFCRNALIYFDLEAKRRFVAQFSEALQPGGFLFVGHSESLHGMSTVLKLIHFPGAMGYQKPLA